MEIRLISAFKTQKRGNSPEEYEDAFLYSEDLTKHAIADGATESCFSNLWADILVEKFISDTIEVIDKDWLLGCQKDFSEKIDITSLSWSAENKITTEGTFSTLLGLVIDTQLRSFFCVAFGDSCLFWLDCNGVNSFPYLSVEEFSKRPFLLGSLPYCITSINSENNQKFIRKSIAAGTSRFFLMTDAISCWFIKSYLSEEKPWEILDEMCDKAKFDDFIEKLRDEKKIKNDDTTLVVFEVKND